MILHNLKSPWLRGTLSVRHARPHGGMPAPGWRASQPAHMSHVPRACDGAASAERGDWTSTKHDPCPQGAYKSGTNLKYAINTKNKQKIQWTPCFSTERAFLTLDIRVRGWPHWELWRTRTGTPREVGPPEWPGRGRKARGRPLSFEQTARLQARPRSVRNAEMQRSLTLSHKR